MRRSEQEGVNKIDVSLPGGPFEVVTDWVQDA